MSEALCPLVALNPQEMTEAGVAWVQRDGAVYFWSAATGKFEVAEGPLLPEGFARGRPEWRAI